MPPRRERSRSRTDSTRDVRGRGGRTKSTRKAPSKSGIRFKWIGLDTPPVANLKRFYNLETLANAVEKHVRENDQFIVPSVRQTMGPTPITAFTFELIREYKHKFVFRVAATNAKRGRSSFAFTVAKNVAGATDSVLDEFQNLLVLHKRVGQHVVRPLRGGRVYLPDRLNRRSKGREIYAYMTAWLGGFQPLGVARNHQFSYLSVPPLVFGREQTEQLKGQIVEIIARSFDAKQNEAMAIPKPNTGAFLVSKPAGKVPKIRLVACRKLAHRVNPARLVNNILSAQWDIDDRKFRLAPEDPDVFVAALSRAVGKKEARNWITAYAREVEKGTFSQCNALPVDVLTRAAR